MKAKSMSKAAPVGYMGKDVRGNVNAVGGAPSRQPLMGRSVAKNTIYTPPVGAKKKKP